jgi:branched-chain amino acid aminotransferase
MAALETTSKIWINGELIDWDDAKVHVLTHALHYGTAAFEGIRAYETTRGTAVFRLTDHMKRLHESAKIIYMDIPYSVEELVEGTKELFRATGVKAGYVRPLAYRGYGEMGLNPLPNPVDVLIAIWPWGAYLPQDGIRVHISSWQRPEHNALPPSSKTSANYVNSGLAKVGALQAGYDEAIMLNSRGEVAEASAANIFVVKDGEVITPPASSGALRGFRRDSVMKIASDLGYVIKEIPVVRADLYTADELFLTGTASEVAPIKSVDDRLVGDGSPGPVTLELQQTMQNIMLGAVDRYEDWLEYVGS